MTPPTDSPRSLGAPARGLRSGAIGLGLRQCGLGQDLCAGAARDPPPARRHAARQDSLPHLHQGGGRQYGDQRVRHAGALDRAHRRRARCRHPCHVQPMAAAEGRAPARAGCSRRRSTRRAASRCRPSMPSAPGCCSSFRSRPMSRRALLCSTRHRKQLLDRLPSMPCCRLRPSPTARSGARSRASSATTDQTFRDVLSEAIRRSGRWPGSIGPAASTGPSPSSPTRSASLPTRRPPPSRRSSSRMRSSRPMAGGRGRAGARRQERYRAGAAI